MPPFDPIGQQIIEFERRGNRELDEPRVVEWPESTQHLASQFVRNLPCVEIFVAFNHDADRPDHNSCENARRSENERRSARTSIEGRERGPKPREPPGDPVM